jgi:hypothetical protein
MAKKVIEGIVMAKKFLKLITPYIQHYLKHDSATRNMHHLRDIAVFMSGVKSKRPVTLDIYAFDGGSRDGEEDQLIEFKSFTDCFLHLLYNLHKYQGGGIEVHWSDVEEDSLIFDMLYSDDLANPQSESPGPLNDFLVNQVISHAPSLQGLAIPA